jgi:peptidoglycan/LPS O-acetylase OafA/YrhL
MVLAFHVWPCPVTSFGWAGVDLFFVLSGFLITGILVDSRDAPRRAQTFYLRRALRILPLYYGVLVVFFVVAPLAGVGHSPMYAALENDQTWYWTYLCDWRLSLHHPPFVTYLTHFWTLSIEEQFYVVWPFVVWAGSTTTIRRVAWVIIIGACALRALLIIRNPHTAVPHSLLPCRIDALAIGAVLALTLREPDGAHRLARWVPRVAAGGAVAMALVVAITLARGADSQTNPLMVTLGLPAIDWACAGLVFMAAQTSPRLLEHPLLRAAGRYSYGIYVYHIFVEWPLAQHVLGLRQGTLAHATFSVSATAVVAGLSFHLYESPLLRLKDRVGGRRPTSVPQPGFD